MNIIDRVIRSDSGFRLVIYIACIIILAIYVLTRQTYRNGAAVILFVGAVLTIRQYFAWRIKKRREQEAEKYKEQVEENAPDA